MKRSSLICGVAMFTGLGWLWAQAQQLTLDKDDANESREGTATGRTEKAAYLGVFAAPAGETLDRQLRLPSGVGLVVNAVDPKSPAAGKLQANDLLHKLNDQLLINSAQLAALVRTFKPGDEIALAVIREGKPVTVPVTLAEKERPPLEAEGRPGVFGSQGTLTNVMLTNVIHALEQVLSKVPMGEGK